MIRRQLWGLAAVALILLWLILAASGCAPRPRTEPERPGLWQRVQPWACWLAQAAQQPPWVLGLVCPGEPKAP